MVPGRRTEDPAVLSAESCDFKCRARRRGRKNETTRRSLFVGSLRLLILSSVFSASLLEKGKEEKGTSGATCAASA